MQRLADITGTLITGNNILTVKKMVWSAAYDIYDNVLLLKQFARWLTSAVTQLSV